MKIVITEKEAIEAWGKVNKINTDTLIEIEKNNPSMTFATGHTLKCSKCSEFFLNTDIHICKSPYGGLQTTC